MAAAAEHRLSIAPQLRGQGRASAGCVTLTAALGLLAAAAFGDMDEPSPGTPSCHERFALLPGGANKRVVMRIRPRIQSRRINIDDLDFEIRLQSR